MADDTHHDEGSRLCCGCVNDKFLCEKIRTEGEEQDCSFCDDFGPTFSLGEIADLVEGAFNEHFERTSAEPTGWEYAMIREIDYDWDREGDQVHYLISEIAGIDEEIAAEIVTILSEKHADWDSTTMGEECEFDKDSHYVPKSVLDYSDYQFRWSDFERRLKTECRFIGKSSQCLLDDVFAGIDSFSTRDGNAVVQVIGPDTDTAKLYRARVFQTYDGMTKGLMRPDLEIGPPPLGQASAGRMNAQGISVFYGALDPNTALAEVRPPVGASVVVAKFEILQSLRVLNLAALKQILIRESYFDPNCRYLREKAAFLEHLSKRMTRPVMPEREQKDGYLITQVIADYLASEHGLDGMVYPSVQVKDGVNIVLFHQACRTEELDIPDGTDIHVEPDGWSDDGPDPNFLVTEIHPTPKSSHPVDYRGHKHDPLGIMLDLPDQDLDQRPNSLRVCTDDVEVRRVTFVEFSSDDSSVRREIKPKANGPAKT